MKYVRGLLFAALAFLATPALAQWQVTNHGVPVGRGAGVTGFGVALPGAAGLPYVSNGATSDASFQAIGNGAFGTNVPANSYKCNNTGSTGSLLDCTLGPNVAAMLASMTSANVRAAVTDETGTGLLYFQNGALGTPSSGILGTGVTIQAGNVTWTGTIPGGALAPISLSTVGSNGGVTGTLGVGNGGTGLTTLPVGYLTCGAVTSPFGTVPTSVGTTSLPLISNGAACPTYQQLSIAAGTSGWGTGVLAAVQVAVGSAGSPVVNGGVLGTPSSGVGTNLTALNASNLSSGTVAAARGGAGTITGALKGNGSGVVTQAACADLSNAGPGCSAAAGQLPGEPSTGNAAAGDVGEYVSSTVLVGSCVTITTSGTPVNVTSISLTAGDWDISGLVGFNPVNTASLTQIIGSISTTSATLNTTPGNLVSLVFPATVYGGSTQTNAPMPPVRASLSATTTYFLVAQDTHTVANDCAFGIIRARRVR